MFESAEAQFAIHAAREASRLVRLIQTEMVGAALTKDDRSPVTVADFAAQALVGQRLAAAFPDDPLVAEEDSKALRGQEQRGTRDQVAQFVARFEPPCTSEVVCDWIDRGGGTPAARFWTLDPIDGTKGFLRGEQYAVALALIEHGQVQLGVLGCPNLVQGRHPKIGGSGSLVLAARGKGTWTAALQGDQDDWSQLRVSDRAAPADARLLRSVESGHTNTGKIGEVIAALELQADPVLMDSQAKYAVLGAGAGDVLLRLLSSRQPDYREKIWDQAAGSIIVEEAGGRITDLHGRPLDFATGRTLANNRGIVATNGRLHDALLAALNAVGA